MPGQVGRAQQATRLVELIQRVGRGDTGCFAELYDDTSPLVYGAALQILQSPRLATAVTEEVYVEVWRLAGRYNASEGSVLAWVMSLAHRHAAARVRVVGDQSLAAGLSAPSGDGAFTYQGGGDEFRRLDTERARKALDSLSENHRQVVTLAYLRGCSLAEVARILGLPVSTVTTLLRDGLTNLRNALGVVA